MDIEEDYRPRILNHEAREEYEGHEAIERGLIFVTFVFLRDLRG
jgi:hypothetical protein